MNAIVEFVLKHGYEVLFAAGALARQTLQADARSDSPTRLERTEQMLTQHTKRRSTMWQKSRSWAAKFGPALVLALVACSVTYAQDVRTNYMPGTDFSKYHTYAWVNDVQGVPAVGSHPDQILDAQVKEAIDSQMVAKGFTKVEDGSKADLLLGYQLAIDQEKRINGFGDNLGSLSPWAAWGPWGAAGARGGVAPLHFRP